MSLQIDHIRDLFSDLTPIPQDDGPEPVVAIQYPADFVAAMDIFRAVLKAKEFSQRSLLLSEHIIRINSANYTAWQFRRQTIDALGGDWLAELKLCNSIAESSSKNYQLWCHRRESVKRLRDPSRELSHTAEVFAEDPKNYHAWGHRQWVIEEFNLWEGELEYIEELLVQDPYNNSAWNQRWFAVTRNNSIPVWDDETIVQREVEFAMKHLEKVVNNESPWNYIFGILEKVDFRKAAVDPVTVWTKSILEANPKCRFAAATLFELYEAAYLPERIDRTIELSNLLETKVDTIRAKYWVWRREQLPGKKADCQ